MYGTVLTVGYLMKVVSGELKPGDDASDARWFDIAQLPEDLAFDHNEVATFAIAKLKSKSAYREQAQRQEEPAT